MRTYEELNFMKKFIIITLLVIVFNMIPAFAETQEEWVKKGNELVEKNNYEEAITCYDKALEIKQDFVPALANKSIVLMMKAISYNWSETEYIEGKECISKIIKAYPGLKGIDINTKYESDLTLLHMAIYYTDRELIKLLISGGADVNGKSKENITPLFTSLFITIFSHKNKNNPSLIALESQSREIIELLIFRGANVNGKILKGYPILIIVGIQGNKELFEFFVSRGADVNVNLEGNNILHLIARGSNKEIVEFIIDKGIDVNGKNKDGYTPLHMAAEAYNKDMVEVLISKGADVNAKDNNGHTPLDIANGEDIKEFLKTHGARTGNK
jgi:ankyrin repeat protein